MSAASVSFKGAKWAFGILVGITFGGMMAFAMGMAAVGIIPILLVMGPPLFFLARVQKREYQSEEKAMRAADAERSAQNPPPPLTP
jgi:uncharacterized membrane protein